VSESVRTPVETTDAMVASKSIDGTDSAGPAKPKCSCSPTEPSARDSDHEDDDEHSRPAGVETQAPPRSKLTRSMLCRNGVHAAECSCPPGGGALVYALAELGYDLGTQARLDAINAEMDEGKFPTNPRDMHEFLTQEANSHFASAILWTLNHDATPIYAVRPEGAFARETYARLVEFLGEQLDGKAERVSIPGVFAGNVTLLSGQSVPVVIPELRGMYNWTTKALIDKVAGGKPDTEAAQRQRQTKAEGMRNFLERIYYEVRNLGQTPQDRALNFAATNAFTLERVFEEAANRALLLDEIGVDRSPICRPDSDCWDVRLIFFDPMDTLAHARTAYRYSVDVSDVVPVLIGPVRSWAVR